jgi:lysophospholipase L1-like esterase
MPFAFRFTRRLLFAVGLLSAAGFAAPAQAAEKHILVFGDSLSWGWMPTEKGFPTTRYRVAERWPAIMAAALGQNYEVSVNAVSGRTTDVSYPQGIDTLTGADFNGLKALPGAIAAETPLDLVIVFLGTNDLRADVGRAPDEIAAGAMRVAALAAKSTGVLTAYAPPKALVVVPPPVGDVSRTPIAQFMAGALEKSRGLAKAYAAAAAKAGIPLFDAATATTTDGVDGIHFTVEDNRRLGAALAARVRAMLPP